MWDHSSAAGKAGPLLGTAFCLSVVFLTIASACAGKRKVPLDIPEGSVGIIAYGSLVSLSSFEQTLGHKYPGPIHQIHLAGYERAWACVRPFNDARAPSRAQKMAAFLTRGSERVPIAGTAELNISAKKGGGINAILYVISREDMANLDKREWGYQRVDVTDKIEELRFRGGKVYVYEGIPGRSEVSSAEKGEYILIKEFRDMVTGACDAVGKSFREEFDKSTRPCPYEVVSYKDIIWEESK
jgi:hypothetical protein